MGAAGKKSEVPWCAVDSGCFVTGPTTKTVVSHWRERALGKLGRGVIQPRAGGKWELQCYEREQGASGDRGWAWGGRRAANTHGVSPKGRSSAANRCVSCVSASVVAPATPSLTSRGNLQMGTLQPELRACGSWSIGRAGGSAVSAPAKTSLGSAIPRASPRSNVSARPGSTVYSTAHRHVR